VAPPSLSWSIAPSWLAKKPTPEAETNEAAVVEEDTILTLSAKTLAGDLRDFILDRLKHDHSPLPWNVRPEADQRDAINRATSAAERIVQRAVEVIAADGRKVIKATLVKVAVKDVIQGVVEMLKSDAQRHDFFDATGSEVMIVVADASAFLGARGEVKVDKDQKSLPIPTPEEEHKRDLEDCETQGYNAGSSGRPKEDNPFKILDGEFHATWNKGWDEGRLFWDEREPDTE